MHQYAVGFSQPLVGRMQSTGKNGVPEGESAPAGLHGYKTIAVPILEMAKIKITVFKPTARVQGNEVKIMPVVMNLREWGGILECFKLETAFFGKMFFPVGMVEVRRMVSQQHRYILFQSLA